MKRVLVFLLLMVFPVLGMAATIHVPGDQPTIQAGIDAAMDGDTVLVADGTYTGDGNYLIDFNGKAITVRSENGAENCIVDCEGAGRGFKFHSGEGEDSVLQGFTIRGAIASWGGGINCTNFSSPVITNNIITGNSVTQDGAGISCGNNSSPVITNNTITGNSAGTEGGGISCVYSSPQISNNSITGNSAVGAGGGIYCAWEASPQISNNTITANSTDWGGGICCGHLTSPLVSGNTITNNTAEIGAGGVLFWESTAVFTNNLVFGNSSPIGGGLNVNYGSDMLISNNSITGNHADENKGGGIAVLGASSATLSNNILWGNEALTGSEGCVGGSDTLTISYSDVEGGQGSIALDPGSTLNWGAGMIDEDPLFETGPDGDYYLGQDPCQPGVDNPCVDTGNPFSPMIEGTTRSDSVQDAGVVDMGYHYALLDTTVAVDLGCVPDSGVLPFATQLSVTLGNVVAYYRTVAGRINLTLASGTTYQSWRAGYTNLGPNEMYVTSWMQTLPALGSLVGENVFELHAEDVTPSPYNQPPYPPSGDTDTCTVTVTAMTP